VPLTPEQQAIADKVLECRVLRCTGQVYEDFFVDVMTLRDGDFRPVKPQGPLGDKKNDGFCGNQGKYFQVYAPEDISQKITDAVDKLEADFAGLHAYWNTLSPVKEFYYVLNDRFKGTYPTIEAALLKLKKKHGLAECRPFLNSDLMRIIGELSDRNLIKIVGQLPSPKDISDLDFSVFTDVLSHVIEHGNLVTPGAILRVPDFKEKLRLNRISDPVASLITAANLQSGAVDSFFSSHGTFSKTAVRDKLAEIYETCFQATNTQGVGHGEPGDVIFFSLLEKVTPMPISKHGQDAAIVLLAYFFETCDIYKDPGLL